LGADGCLVFVGCDLNLTGGGTTVRIVLHFSIVYFFSLALLWGDQRYPPSAALECYDAFQNTANNYKGQSRFNCFIRRI
jgi:hypothetical protein